MADQDVGGVLLASYYQPRLLQLARGRLLLPPARGSQAAASG